MNLIWRWLVTSLSLYLTCLAGHTLKLGLGIDEKDPWRILLAGAAIGLVNSFIIPVFRLLTLPMHCLTLGLSTAIVNIILFYVVGNMNMGMRVDTFWGAAFGVIVVSLISSVLSFMLPGKEKKD
jgi:putative membrane protein